jgi:hypothetical protein
MKGMFLKANMDFDLYLEGGDLTNLTEGNTLETNLVDEERDPINKKITLRKLGEGEQLEGEEDGIYFRSIGVKGRRDFNSIKKYEAVITQRLIDQIMSEGQTSPRYNGISKITIYKNRRAPF